MDPSPNIGLMLYEGELLLDDGLLTMDPSCCCTPQSEGGCQPVGGTPLFNHSDWVQVSGSWTYPGGGPCTGNCIKTTSSNALIYCTRETPEEDQHWVQVQLIMTAVGDQAFLGGSYLDTNNYIYLLVTCTDLTGGQYTGQMTLWERHSGGDTQLGGAIEVYWSATNWLPLRLCLGADARGQSVRVGQTYFEFLREPYGNPPKPTDSRICLGTKSVSGTVYFEAPYLSEHEEEVPGCDDCIQCDGCQKTTEPTGGWEVEFHNPGEASGDRECSPCNEDEQPELCDNLYNTTFELDNPPTWSYVGFPIMPPGAGARGCVWALQFATEPQKEDFGTYCNYFMLYVIAEKWVYPPPDDPEYRLEVRLIGKYWPLGGCVWTVKRFRYLSSSPIDCGNFAGYLSPMGDVDCNPSSPAKFLFYTWCPPASGYEDQWCYLRAV